MSTPNLATEYSKYFRTHVNSGVTKGMFQDVPAKELAELAKGDVFSIAKFLQESDVKLNPAARKAFTENIAIIGKFAEAIEASGHPVQFTQDGFLFVPPKLRAAFPEYTDLLLQSKDVAGTTAITLVENHPIPVFKDGEQVGGFEAGDGHAFLTTVDKRSGKPLVSEKHQSFLEDSNKWEMRPGLVGVNVKTFDKLKKKGELKEFATVEEYLKSPEAELDGIGMIGNENALVGLASYQCELISDPTKAFNWDNGVPGANFNYIPGAAIEFELNSTQMSILLADSELATRESGIKAAPESKGKQNESGYVAATRDAFYPDGSERYVVATVVDGETVFTNASKGTKGAMRVQEYDTIVNAADMQVVVPYNHWGASHTKKGELTGMDGTANCMSSVLGLIQGVNGHGRGEIGLTAFRDKAIGRFIQSSMEAASAAKPVNDGKSSAEIATVYETTLKNGTVVKLYDFRELQTSVIADIGEQRAKAIADKQRPPEKELTLYPTGTIGGLIASTHEQQKDMGAQAAKAAASAKSGANR